MKTYKTYTLFYVFRNYLQSSYLCLFVCPITILEPLDLFASNFDWGTT